MKKMPIRSFFILPAFLLLWICSSCRQGIPKEDWKAISHARNDQRFRTPEEKKDAQFVVEAVSSSYEMILLADVANLYTQNLYVRDLAIGLKFHHYAILNDLQKYALEKGISIPFCETSQARTMVTGLSNESERFDKEWLEKMSVGHAQSISGLEDGSKLLTNHYLKRWAGKTLASLREHHTALMASHRQLNEQFNFKTSWKTQNQSTL